MAIIMLWQLVVIFLVLYLLKIIKGEAEEEQDNIYKKQVKFMQDNIDYQRKRFYESC